MQVLQPKLEEVAELRNKIIYFGNKYAGMLYVTYYCIYLFLSYFIFFFDNKGRKTLIFDLDEVYINIIFF